MKYQSPNQLGLAPDSLEILIMCYSMDLSQMGFIERHEFLKMSQFIGSRATLKNHLVEHRMGLRFEMELSKKLHRFVFGWINSILFLIIFGITSLFQVQKIKKNNHPNEKHLISVAMKKKRLSIKKRRLQC